MRPSLSGDDRRALCFAVIISTAAAAFAVARFDGQRIAAVTTANAQIVDDTARESARVRQRPRIEAAVHTLRRRSQLALNVDRDTLVAVFLGDAAHISAQHRTRIASISAGGTASVDNNPTPSAKPDAVEFDARPLDVTIEGRYVDVLATIRGLTGTRVLAALDVRSITRAGSGTGTDVIAALHVTLERLPTGSDPHVRSRTT